jgi:predicted aminopeptidase
VNSISIAAKLRAVVVCALAVPSTGCYEWQAAQGQMRLMLAREPINQVIARPTTPAAVRAQLRRVSAIREFASRELGLPDNGSYRSFADLGREYVVWNVFAAPEFSIEAKQWCYPIVGCVAYRGYFHEPAARSLAAQLQAQGMDVAVEGVAAYSTLGHFDDPILNTMLGWSDAELAGIIFHELTHQLIYVANDASFNEALASLVEEEGVRRWLTAQDRAQDLADYSRLEARYARVTDLLIATRAKLGELYGSHLDTSAMMQQKTRIFAEATVAFDALKTEWDGRAPFQEWFDRGLNNAYLVSIATYETCVPGFRRELAAADGDLPKFYARVRQLARLDQAQRDALVCADAAPLSLSSPV